MGFLGEGVTNAVVTWQEPRATAAPKGHLLQRIGWSYQVLQSHHQGQGTCSSTKHLLARADPSAEQGKPPEKRLCSACWSPSELAGITSQGEGTSSRAGRTNRSPTSPPSLSSTFLATASCKLRLTHVPRWSQLLQARWREASVGVCTASCKDLLAKRSLGGSQCCSRPALLLGEGKRCPKGHCRESGPVLGCESQPGMPGSTYQGHPVPAVSSCPRSAPALECRDRL